MYKYIGIRGHRGAGKNTVSYLIGVAIDYLLNHSRSFEGFDSVYHSACERVKQSEDFLDEADFNRVYFGAFSETPKVALSILTGIPFEWMNNDWKKDSVFVNMQDFTIHECKTKRDIDIFKESTKVFSAERLATLTETGVASFDTELWLSLRDLIIYFGKFTVQFRFGRAAWVNALRVNDEQTERFYADDKRTVYKIFTDVKFPTEISYLKDRKGVIVKVSRPNNEKEASSLSEALNNDNRFDYDIVIEDDVASTSFQKKIEQIALEVINL